jgi:hypothetical protein
MKKKIKTNFFVTTAIVVACFASSCKKEEDKQIPPNISFKTGATYTSADVTLAKSDTILVGINAEKTEDKDLLTRFVATQQYNAESVTTILNESFNQDTYSKDVTIVTRNVTGIEKYTYTIINRDGLTATKTLTITVN